MNEPRFLSVDEAAKRIGAGVSRDLVLDMIHRGELPALDRGHRARKLIPAEAVDRLAEACMVGWDATAAVERLRSRFVVNEAPEGTVPFRRSAR